MAWRLRRAAVSTKIEPIDLRQLLHLHGQGGQGAVLLLLLFISLVFVDELFLLKAATIAGMAALIPLGLALVFWHWGADVLRLLGPA
jgi:hypothetical protein